MAKRWEHPKEFVENVYTVRIPNLANYKIHFVFSNNIQKSWLKRFHTNREDLLNEASGLHQGTPEGHSWLFYSWDVGVSTMVHECWHAVYAMLNWGSIPLDNNELIAYTMGYVVSKGQSFQTINDVRIGRTKCQKKSKLKRAS